MLKNKKVLITGATGFIGANLVHFFLKEGASVIIFTRNASDKWRIRKTSGNLSEYTVDLSDGKETENEVTRIKPDIIFHNAIYGGHSLQDDTNEIFNTNLLGTINLLNACRKVKFDLFVHSGSSSEYGVKDSSFKEDDILKPVTDYGVSKAAATLYSQALAKRVGLKIITFRLFSPYGYYEGPSRLIPSVIMSCLNGKNPKLSSPEPVRDFIFIEDIISAYMEAVRNSDQILAGEVFNIAYGAQHSVSEVVDAIINITGNKVKPEWGKVDNSRHEPKCWQGDISKAGRLLNWKPKYDLSQGLKKNIDWFHKNIALYG